MELEVATLLILAGGFVTSVISALVARHLIKKYLQLAIDAIGEALAEIFTRPAVKGAMTVLGEKGGAARAEKAVVDKIANDVLDGPKFAGLKMAASAVGMDLDSYIEDHGAIATLQAMQSLGGLLGIDINSVMSSGMNLAVGSEANGAVNPYLK